MAIYRNANSDAFHHWLSIWRAVSPISVLISNGMSTKFRVTGRIQIFFSAQLLIPKPTYYGNVPFRLLQRSGLGQQISIKPQPPYSRWLDAV